ncbi:MAG: hypothetical protein WA688_09585, partial [Thermoplasmata archaeon]
MPEALVRSGRWLRWVDPEGRIVEERLLDARPARVAELLVDGFENFPPEVLQWVRRRATGPGIEVSDRPMQEWLQQHGLIARVAGLAARRAMRAGAFKPDREERAVLLAFARRRLEHAMQAPEATLSALAREEERVRRVLRRETNAADSWVSEGTPM